MNEYKQVSISYIPTFVMIDDNTYLEIKVRHRAWYASDEVSKKFYADVTLSDDRRVILCADDANGLMANWKIYPSGETMNSQGYSEWERPVHYGGEANPFEPIKIIEHYDLNFNLGNVIKYTLRAPFKGSLLNDLRKAYTYLGFEIRRLENAANEKSS